MATNEDGMDKISKAAAIIGTVIATGQAGTSWINGYWQAENDRIKAEQELKLAKLKETSELAESYIKLIIDNDTSEPDRVMLLGALSQLENHPLQNWAKLRYQEIQKGIDHINTVTLAQTEAVQLKTENEREASRLSSEIEILNAEIELHRDDIEKTKELAKLRIVKSEELSLVRAKLSIASVRVEVSTPDAKRQATTEANLEQNRYDRAGSIISLANQINEKLLMNVFPESSRKNVQKNAHFLSNAIQEFKISDPRIAATIIATILIEAPNFDTDEEKPHQYNTRKAPFDLYEGRRDLGNVSPGDGYKYRGRGFFGLTGRANYRQMSQRLGLGTRLEDNPEDVKSPEVSARIVCTFFSDRLSRFVVALDNNDLVRVRKLTIGGTFGLDRFVSAYRKLLSNLNLPVTQGL